MKLNTQSGKVAFSSIFAALALSMMFAGSLFPFADYSAVAIGGLFLVPIVIDVGRRYATIAYFASAILGLIIVPNKEIALFYAIFFGYYPILKSVFESCKNKIVEFVLKFAVFNLTMIAAFLISINLLEISKEEYVIFDVYLPWLFLIMGNIVFILYDFCLTKMIILYINVIREKIMRRL